MEKSELEKSNPEELINLSKTNTSGFRWTHSDIYNVLFEKFSINKDKAFEIFSIATLPDKTFDEIHADVIISCSVDGKMYMRRY